MVVYNYKAILVLNISYRKYHDNTIKLAIMIFKSL